MIKHTKLIEKTGRSWSPFEGEPPVGGGLLLPTGDQIKIFTPKAIKTGDIKLPIPVGANKDYYKLGELPDILQDVYLNRLTKDGASWTTEHEVLIDPLAIRYTVFGMFPVVM